MTGTAPWRALVAVGAAAPLLPVAGLAAGLLAGDPWRAPPAGLGALLLRSVGLAVAVSAVAVPLGAALAWLDRRHDYPGRRALAALSLLPLALPSFLLAGALRHALGPGGPLGAALGLPAFAGHVAAAVVLTLATAPLAQVLVGAALARVPAAEEEAARTLGATRGAAFRAVVLPRLRPALVASALLVQLYVLSDFGAVAVLDAPVLTWRIYQAVAQQRLGDAAVLGGLLLAATLALLVAGRWAHGRVAEAGVANPRPVERRPLGPAGLAGALVAHGLTAGLGCLLPVATLGLWVLDGWSRGLPFAPLGEPVAITLKVGAVGAALTVLLAWAPGWAAGRHGARAVDLAVLLGHALPGVLVAFGVLRLALVLPGAPTYRALGEAGVLLLAGYVARFLPEAHAALRTSAAAFDPRQDESARVLGAGRARRLLRVVLPAVAPGVAAATGLVVAQVAKELPITLLLGPAAGARTLSFRVYDRLEEALLHDAGAAGLVLVAVCLAAFALTARWGGER
ncbi:MAG: ABC transporter permease subunit [Planctomycetes bacterium]|nr:ABC transporter permease subunit [Planctomycetota bacterium]